MIISNIQISGPIELVHYPLVAPYGGQRDCFHASMNPAPVEPLEKLAEQVIGPDLAVSSLTIIFTELMR